MATSDTQNTQGSGGTAPDLSQYIRTYAKDVAKASGKGNVGAIQKSTPPPPPVPVPSPVPQKKQGEISDGVEFDAVEQPFFDRSSGREEKDPANTPLELETRAELDSFVNPGGAGKEMPGATIAPAPAPVDEQRETVLARLRAKMAANPVSQVPPASAAPIPVPLPPAPAPAIERITPAPAPVFETPKEAPVYP